MIESLVMAVSWAGKPMMSRTSAALAILKMCLCLSETDQSDSCQLQFSYFNLPASAFVLQPWKCSGPAFAASPRELPTDNPLVVPEVCFSSYFDQEHPDSYWSIILTATKQTIDFFGQTYLYTDPNILINLMLYVSLNVDMLRHCGGKREDILPYKWKLWPPWHPAFQPNALDTCICKSLMGHFLEASNFLWHWHHIWKWSD